MSLPVVVMMWRFLVLCVVLQSFVQDVHSFSFFSNVLYRTYYPRVNPTPPQNTEAAKQPPPLLSMDTIIRTAVMTLTPTYGLVYNVAQQVLPLMYKWVFPNEFPLPDITYSLPLFGSLRMVGGKIKGIQTYSTPEVSRSTSATGMIAEVKFSELTVTYEEISVDMLGKKFDRRAKGTLWFISNKLKAEMTAAPLGTFLINLPLFRCVFFIKAARLSELGDVSTDIRDDRNQRVPLINAVVDVMINDIERRLADQLTLIMNTYLRDRLPGTRFSVCADPEIQKVIDSLSSAGNKPPTPSAVDDAPKSKSDNGEAATSMWSSLASLSPIKLGQS